MRFNFAKIVPVVFWSVLAGGISLFAFIKIMSADNNITPKLKTGTSVISNTTTPTPFPTSYTIPGKLQVFQSFNNCGPASLSMLLSYFGIDESQEKLGEKIRPYQVPGGDNDDKSVTLEELADVSQDYDLISFHRPNGDLEKIKKFVSNGIPILVRTWLHPNEDIGHYRLIRGYNDETHEIIQDDSFEGKDIAYSYDVFMKIWEPYNYEYLVMVPKNKQKIAENIIGEDLDIKTAWEKAAENSHNSLNEDPNNIYDRFNLSVAYYNIGEYKKSVEEFEKVENLLPFRTMWYQIEPIEAYYKLGNYNRVFEITDKILNNQNRAFSELYLIRGDTYKKQGNLSAAKSEYDQALFYNKNLKAAQTALLNI